MLLLRQYPPAKSRSALSNQTHARFGFGRILRNAGSLSAVLALSILSACKESPTQSGAIGLIIAPSAATVSPGAPAVVAANVTRGGTFTGDVTLAAEGLPAGVTATFAPASLGSSVTSSALTLTAGAGATSGTTTVTVRASGTGVAARTATMQLTVNASGVTLTAGSATTTTPQGLGATVALTVARLGGFTGNVNLAAEGLPANVSAAFVPQSLGAGVTNSTLTLTAASNAAVGTSNITIRATGAGIADQTIPVQLVITAGAQPNFTLTATPAAVSVSPGGVVSSAIAIARSGGFIDNIGFVTSALPQGVEATFTPNPANANTATLQFATTTTAVPGTYTITVTGTGGTVAPRTVNVMLTVNPPAAITLALNPVTTSVNAGGSVQNTLTITRLGGFANDITFAGQNLPTGITIVFAPATLTGAASTTTATISAAANVAPGFYNITMRATGVGSLITTTASINMTVLAPQSFGVALTSGNVSIASGATGTLTANITRNGGFTGAVNFTATNLPSGITATVTPAAATGASATVNLTVAANTAAGIYNGTLVGAATGLASTSTPFTVTVTGGGGGGGTGAIRWQFCSANGLPLFFAFKNGKDGVWTRVQPNASNLYSFDVTQPEGGVFFVKPSGATFATTIQLATRNELENIAANECVVNPTGFKTITGSVVALGATEIATITMGGGNATANTASLNFTLNNVLNGAQDLVALRNTVTMTGLVTDKILIRRNLNLASGGVLAPLDFASAEAFNPTTATITLGNLGADNATLATFFQTQNGGSVALGIATTGTTANRDVFGVPAANLAGTDLHFLLAAATGANSTRSVLSFTNQLSSANVTFGAVLDQPLVSSVTNTVSRPRASGNFQNDYQSSIGMTFTQASGISVTINATRAYFGASGYDLEYPDLTSIMQFDPQWGLARSTTTNYTITASNATAGSIGNGTNIKTASLTGSYTSSAIRRP